jgi:DNA invertase Pin-like site-specific DNA recombinase
VLTVWKLDRLGRSMAELVGIVDDLRKRGVGLKVLTGEGAAIGTTRPEGRFILGVFAAFAEFERELIRERTREGMKAARRRGKRLGRAPALGPDKLDMARRLIAENKGRAVVAAMLGIDPSTLRRALNGKS